MRLIFLFFSIALLFAQQPAVENARIETRAFSGTLASELAQFGAGPFWVGYSEPIIAGRHGEMCCSDDGCRGSMNGTPVRLEGLTAMMVLIRIADGRTDQLRILSPDCRLDAGGLPFHWITGVPPEASVEWLRTQAPGEHPDRAIFAIAIHEGPAADRALNDLTSVNQTERVRERTAFWLGATRGARGIEILKRMLANDSSENVRDRVVFSLAQSKDPAGIAIVIETAKNDKSPHVRAQALFWLARKAGDKQAAEIISNAAVSDPDRAVKERAVFALKQLPPDQGIPLLINLAKNNPDPNVRKKAMFWLGQSQDPRALEFFTQVLKQ